MNTKTAAKAKRAAEMSSELYSLLNELQKELSGDTRRNYAAYLLVTDVKEAVYGKKATEDIMSKLHAVAQMGEKE